MFETDTDTLRKIRAAPSPTPMALRRSHDSLISDNEQVCTFFNYRLLNEYLEVEISRYFCCCKFTIFNLCYL